MFPEFAYVMWSNILLYPLSIFNYVELSWVIDIHHNVFWFLNVFYSAPFWPLSFESDLEYKPYVFDVLEFTETQRILASGQNVNSMFANGSFTGKILAVKLDASLC